MFGYTQSISEDDKGNKYLEFKINADYIRTSSRFYDEISTDDTKRFCDNINVIALIIKAFDENYEKYYR